VGAFDCGGDPVPSEAGNLTTPGPIDLQATLAALVGAWRARPAMDGLFAQPRPGPRGWTRVPRGRLHQPDARHLDYHKTLEDYFRAKAKLLQYVAPDGLEVVTPTIPRGFRLRREHRRVTFGEREGRRDRGAGRLDAAGARFELVTPMGRAGSAAPAARPLQRGQRSRLAACAWGLGVPSRRRRGG